jgi:hypothetical protein
MNRRQFGTTLVVVIVAGLVGGTLSDWAKGRPASAQVELKPRRPFERILFLDPQTRLAVEQMTEASIPPDLPPSFVKGTISWVTFDKGSQTFCALLVLQNQKNILLRTNNARMQTALETAYGHADEVTVEVKRQQDAPSLVEVYEALFVQT